MPSTQHHFTLRPVSTTTSEWILEIGDLRIGAGPADPRAHGLELAAHLAAAAAAVAAHRRCSGGIHSCPLAALDGGFAACEAAPRLARGVMPPPGLTSPEDAARRYVHALRAASTAVFLCRRTAHPAGECWFDDEGTDGCATVLTLAHRMGI